MPIVTKCVTLGIRDVPRGATLVHVTRKGAPPDDPQQPPWRLRRRAIFGSMVFGALVIAYCAIRWDDTSLAQTMVLGGYGLIGTVVAAYVGGAAYQDVRLWKPAGEEPQDGQ